MKPSRKKQSGFTLVELAIVLVIIGLIIGGVLVGQDLIKAAEIRSTLGQIETYNTAVNAFRDKYRYIPGDINSVQAAQFGFTTRSGAIGHGDGNTLLEGCSAGAIEFGCETGLFWNDLNSAALVDGNFTVTSDDLGNGGAAITTPEVISHLPEAKIGRGNFITTFSATGRNFYQITGVTAISNAGVYTLTEALTPQEAFNMDDKIDDGKPLTGGARAMEGTGPINTTAVGAIPAEGVCVSNVAGEPYNTTTDAFANSPSCQVRFRFN
jgi:prepilin-type N-terminal cleavage/methylation domain-containing protein